MQKKPFYEMEKKQEQSIKTLQFETSLHFTFINFSNIFFQTLSFSLRFSIVLLHQSEPEILTMISVLVFAAAVAS